MNITGNANTWTYNTAASSGALYFSGTTEQTYQSNGVAWGAKLYLDASRNWTGSTNSVAPQTSALGSGSALDVTPAYYTCHMWLRLT